MQGSPADFLSRRKAYVVSQGIRIEYVESLGGANGCSSGDRPRPRNVQEIEAEAVSSDYILMYDGTVESIAASLDAVRHTASEIVRAITPGQQ